MTAPEREALVKELRDCTEALSDIISCNSERGDDAVPTWVATMLRGVRATIRDALQALSAAPAVTVTEDENSDEYRLAVAYQVIGCFLDHLAVFDTDGGQGLLDYFAKHDGAKDPLPFSVADLVASPRKSERDAALEEAAALVENSEEVFNNKRGRLLAPRMNGNLAGTGYATAIRALKSTTPQTGSQE